MTKLKSFKLGRRLVRICRWVIRPKRRPDGYQRLSAPDCQTKTMTKICNWCRCLKRGAKLLCSSKVLCSSRSSDAPDAYTRMDSDELIPKPVQVPKGHLAVYVGQKDDDPHRFLVPVFYFNHPLFGELLREAEKEYGFDHPGGITIPCPVAEFENVQTKIAAGNGKNLLWKRRLSPG